MPNLSTSALDSLAPTSFSGDESDSRPSHGKNGHCHGHGQRRQALAFVEAAAPRTATTIVYYGYSTAIITRSLLGRYDRFGLSLPLARSFSFCG
ncbi:hypothetical protein V491_02489 [Pseudogymnoascus sp. VKM F-3775]|nr:hypothetical protein V491_02489 [Pseudogymnoascus sp. VKM F-3775]